MKERSITKRSGNYRILAKSVGRSVTLNSIEPQNSWISSYGRDYEGRNKQSVSRWSGEQFTNQDE